MERDPRGKLRYRPFVRGWVKKLVSSTRVEGDEIFGVG